MDNWAKVAAALLAVVLAGCAAGNGGNGAMVTSGGAGKGVMYCMDGKLFTVAAGHRCAWAKSHKEACEATEMVTVANDMIASGPTRGGMCANGDRIVHVVLK